MKQVNATQVALIASLILAIVLTLAEWLMFLLLGVEVEWYVHLIIFILVFCCNGLTFRFLYGKYIFENLQKIYKHILRLKNPREVIRPYTENRRDITSEINRILVDWRNESREEIDHLKQVETYRREFLSNVSHELKTPIFSVQGYIHTLIDGGIEDQNVNIHYLSRASKSIDRLISIVDDLESISKLEAGELIVEKRTFDMNELVRDVEDSLELQAKEKDIKLEVNYPADKAVYVFADKDLLRQVIVNLMVNSIKYGTRGGQTLTSFTDAGEKIIVDVQDSGIGIEKHHLPRLFERFYRVDKSRSRDEGGTGLGLAIVKHILEAHGETIQVDSTPGKGTTFTFSLTKSK
ncbi:MAG: sensor histidine kinase [Bacteroidetes bacterium]|nr:sensor histidine kinase [Bacteroidota bacterium]